MPATTLLRQLAELVTTPLLPEDFLDLVAPLRSPVDLRARVVEVVPETADAVTLVLAPGRGWRGHRPGQYVRLGVDVDGVRQWRTYSLTSRPGERHLRVTVKAVPDGLVSTHLVRSLQTGALVHLGQAEGEFVLPEAAPAKALFVTGGSGITPVMGILRSHGHELADAVLVHSAPTPADVIFARELRELQCGTGVRVVVRHTDTDGVLTTDEILDLVPDAGEREVWACGPTGLLDALEAWPMVADRLHLERFRPAQLVVGEGGTVRFGRSGSTAVVDGATPLLTAGEDAGVLLPSGCRMGVCFGCVVPLREGAVRDLRNGTLTTAGDGVLVQTCVSAAAGDCALDA